MEAVNWFVIWEWGRDKRTYVWVYSCHGRHVLFRGEDQLVVNDVLGDITEAVECTGGVQCHSHTGAEIDELADAFDARCLVVETRADTFADEIPVCTAADEGHFLHSHDVVQLVADFLRAPQSFPMQEVSGAPAVGVAVRFPLCVNMQ